MLAILWTVSTQVTQWPSPVVDTAVVAGTADYKL